MILTVTINPLLEKRLTIDKISPGNEHRAYKEVFTAGGKGINVSRQLNELGINNLAYTFLGGNNGKILKNLILSEQINLTFVQTKTETRAASLIFEEQEKRLTTFFGLNPEITQSESDEFKSKLNKMIENCEIVVFSGSSPNGLTNDIFSYGIKTANDFDKISILDTYGSHLKDCIEAGPTIIHNNITETATSLDLDLSDEKKITDYLNYLYGKNIKQVYLTNGAKPVYASNFGFIYRADFPEVQQLDATGSGDSFTAGIAYGLHKALTFEETFATSVSLGAVNASKWEICRVNSAEITEVKNKVRIQTIGKKINTIL
ncbi:MAG: 1-phosphofructokinase family hexose kinase [Bacillota bacterium]